MSRLLHQLARNGDISWLSYYFAEFIAQQSDSSIDDWPALSAAMLSQESQAGNACIDLKAYFGEPLFSSRLIAAQDILEVSMSMPGVRCSMPATVSMGPLVRHQSFWTETGFTLVGSGNTKT